MNYLEHEIQTAARMELALLNQSKALRDQRQLMTKRFEVLCKKMSILQHRNSNSNNRHNLQPAAVVATTAGINLPPLFNTTSSSSHCS
jgi:hypothetical protein